MGFFELFLTAVALSMAAMAVSISSGISSSRVRLWDAVKMALFFGAFQAFMPIIGYYIIPLLSAVFGSGVETFVNNFDHWIAFVLLAFIGGKMIIEAIKNEPEDGHTNPFALGTLIVMSIATSIDALATGIVFRGFNLDAGARTFVFLAIGITTFILSLLGVLLGKKLGKTIGAKFRRWAVLGGGIVLVGLGVKILIEHLIA